MTLYVAFPLFSHAGQITKFTGMCIALSHFSTLSRDVFGLSPENARNAEKRENASLLSLGTRRAINNVNEFYLMYI